MRKPTFRICENKDAYLLRGNSATVIVQFLYFLNPKFPASSHLLCLYSLLYVEHGRKPYCWFSHDAAHIFVNHDKNCIRGYSFENVIYNAA